MLQKLDPEQEFLETDSSYLLQPAHLWLLKRRLPYFLIPFALALLVERLLPIFGRNLLLEGKILFNRN
jgi:hypothetical protein